MSDTTFDRSDLLFQIFEVTEYERISARPRFADFDADAVTGMIDTAGQIADTHFAPLAGLLDQNAPEFSNGKVVYHHDIQPALNAYLDAGFLGAVFDPEHGGIGLPETVHQAISFIFASSNISLSGFGLLSVGAGRLIQSFGSAEQKRDFLQPIIEGRFFGTMCLSEPHAGSSLSDITTRAVPLDDGTYRISGRKMWISGGDHEERDNIVHMVLARIPGGPPGVKGISLFIVPKYRLDADGTPAERNDVALAGLNHKMGYHGITNCALNFGDEGHCTGYLVGEAHKGLSYMFQMMNEARIGVGVGAAALGQAGYRAALEYARERPQGRAPVAKDPSAPQVPIIQHADVRRLLLAQKAAVEPALALGLYCAAIVDRASASDDAGEKADCELLLDMLTPIAKSWPSEFCLEANKHSIQVLGGAGYTRDYPVERYYRENRLNPIHEGTHGIQGLDLLGRKAVMGGGKGLALLMQTIRADIDRVKGHETAAPFASHLEDALVRAEAVTKQLIAAMGNDPERGLANATLYLDYMGHIVMGWMWLRIVRAALEREAREGASDFTRGKLQAARYFFNRELVRTLVWQRTLEANDSSAYDMQDGWF